MTCSIPNILTTVPPQFRWRQTYSQSSEPSHTRYHTRHPLPGTAKNPQGPSHPLHCGLSPRCQAHPRLNQAGCRARHPIRQPGGSETGPFIYAFIYANCLLQQGTCETRGNGFRCAGSFSTDFFFLSGWVVCWLPWRQLASALASTPGMAS